MKDKVDLILSETWTRATISEMDKILNETINEFAPNHEIINIQLVESSSGLSRFYIYCKSQ